MWERLAPYRRAFPSRTAVATAGGTWSFETVYAAAERLAGELEGADRIPGRPAALSLPNGPAFVPGLLALWKRGLPVALVSPRHGSEEHAAIAAGAGIGAFLSTPAHAEKLAGMVAGARVSALAPVLGEAVSLTTLEDPPPSPVAEAALLKFTSGSTGEPKGIPLTPEAVEAEAGNVVRTLRLTAEDRILAGVPLSHSYGFDLGVLASLFSGATMDIPDFFVPRRIQDDLDRSGATVFLGVPDQYRRWLEAAPPRAEPLARVRFLLSCTAPLSARTILAFHDRFRMPLCQHYGSSETGAVTNHVPEHVLERPHAVGLPVAGVTVRVVDADGAAVADGEEGEIVVESAALSGGYFMGAPPDRRPFRDGRYWTGDLAVRDAGGFLELHGRVDQVINAGGFKVSPEEVRRVLEAHPGVREAAVLGVPGPAGAEVAAMVVPRERVSREAILAHCYRRLADYKVPRRLVFREELPRGASGKVRVRPEDFSD
jgi:long-chain acyl-CoA synthetase